jgi:hypothetical protein
MALDVKWFSTAATIVGKTASAAIPMAASTTYGTGTSPVSLPCLYLPAEVEKLNLFIIFNGALNGRLGAIED